jgi:hypothetical protein
MQIEAQCRKISHDLQSTEQVRSSDEAHDSYLGGSRFEIRLGRVSWGYTQSLHVNARIILTLTVSPTSHYSNSCGEGWRKTEDNLSATRSPGEESNPGFFFVRSVNVNHCTIMFGARFQSVQSVSRVSQPVQSSISQPSNFRHSDQSNQYRHIKRFSKASQSLQSFMSVR